MLGASARGSFLAVERPLGW